MVCRSAASLLSGYYNGCYSWQFLEFNYERCRECEIKDGLKDKRKGAEKSVPKKLSKEEELAIYNLFFQLHFLFLE